MNTLSAVATVLGLVVVAMATPPNVSSGRKPETLQEKRWATAAIRKDKSSTVEWVANRILRNKKRYEQVARQTGVPWYAIAGLHNMESSLSFRHHLHEGSPLSGRTRYVPKGRPKSGSPPFTWEESAKDALKYDRMHTVRWKEVDNTLYRVEAYNGLGYLKYHKDVPSPYLWSGTQLYKRGKYVSDGKWSSTAISKQMGVGAIWIRLMEKGVSLPEQFKQLR